MHGDLFLMDVTRLEAERALKHARVHGHLPEVVSAEARRLLEEIPDRLIVRALRH